MRRIMVIEEHPHRNSKKVRDRRHSGSLAANLYSKTFAARLDPRKLKQINVNLGNSVWLARPRIEAGKPSRCRTPCLSIFAGHPPRRRTQQHHRHRGVEAPRPPSPGGWQGAHEGRDRCDIGHGRRAWLSLRSLSATAADWSRA
jgi:hypothetical protein